MILGLAVIAVSATTTWSLDAQTLQGSRASMDRQVQMARQHDYTFIDTPERVRYFAEQGWLVRIESTRDFIVKNARLVVDTRNATADVKNGREKIVKA